MAKDGPSQTELDNAKSYLTGSYPLRFDTNAKIANELLGLMVESLGIDYINKRNAEIEAVTIADAKRVAAGLLKVEDLIVTVVGKPEGLKATATTK
jgi:zinc protease